MFIHTYFVLQIILGGVFGELLLTPSETEAERYVNDTYIVTCYGTGTANTTWHGPNGDVISAKKGRIHVEERIDGATQWLSLMFLSIAKTDKGNYTCKSTVDGDATKVSFTLLVVKPIEFQGHVTEQNATEFQKVFIRCEVTGDPLPMVVWQHKGVKVSGPRYKIMPGGLYISNVTGEDEGEYQCRAHQLTQKSSNLRTKSITLVVQHKPRWSLSNTSERDTAYGYMGGVANITCHAKASPLAEYSWSRYNKTLDPDTANVINMTESSVLQVKMINNSVLGDYECLAANGLGEVWKVFELKEGYKPSPPRHVALSAVGVTTAQFNLHASSKENIIGYRIQFTKRTQKNQIDRGDYQDVYTRTGPPYSIIHLKENTEYVYRVAARNAAGLSDYSPTQSFTTRERSTSSSDALKPTFLLVLTFLLSVRTH